MRILLRHESTSSRAMLEALQGWGISLVPEDSNIEDAVGFVLSGIAFLLLYDRASASNPAIYPFIIESTRDNDGEGGPDTWAATRSLHAELKARVRRVILEDDSQ